MKLTEFGKFLRKLRIDNGELLKDMAIKLNVTPSFLSMVETGRRNIPKKWGEEIEKIYSLNLIQKEELISILNRKRVIEILEKNNINTKEEVK